MTAAAQIAEALAPPRLGLQLLNEQTLQKRRPSPLGAETASVPLRVPRVCLRLSFSGPSSRVVLGERSVANSVRSAVSLSAGSTRTSGSSRQLAVCRCRPRGQGSQPARHTQATVPPRYAASRRGSLLSCSALPLSTSSPVTST